MITICNTKGVDGDPVSGKIGELSAFVYFHPVRLHSLRGRGAGRMDPRFLEKQDRLRNVYTVPPCQAPSGYHFLATGSGCATSGCQRRETVIHDRGTAVGGAGEASIYPGRIQTKPVPHTPDKQKEKQP